MANKSLFYLNDDTKNQILEISALSGYAQNVVKEVLEYMLMSWAIKIADNPNKYASLTIPYLGNVMVKYVDDEVLPTGELSTITDSQVVLNDQFKKLIGDLHDEGMTELVPMMEKKIKNAVMIAASND